MSSIVTSPITRIPYQLPDDCTNTKIFSDRVYSKLSLQTEDVSQKTLINPLHQKALAVTLYVSRIQ